MPKKPKGDEEKRRDAFAKKLGLRRLTIKEAEIMDKVLHDVEEAQLTMMEFNGRPPSREFALALTKLEEAEMWIARGFDIDEDNEEQIDEAIDEEDGKTDSGEDDDAAEAGDDDG